MGNKILGIGIYWFALIILGGCTIPNGEPQRQGTPTEFPDRQSAPNLFKLIDDDNLIGIKQRYALDKTIFRQLDGKSPFLYAVNLGKFAIADFIIDSTPDDDDEAAQTFANKGESREQTILVLLDKSSSSNAAVDVTRKYLKYQHSEKTLAGITDAAVKQTFIARAQQTKDREIITVVTRIISNPRSGTAATGSKTSTGGTGASTSSTLNTAEKRKRDQEQREEEKKKRFAQFVAQIKPTELIDTTKLNAADPPAAIGQGSFGEIFEATYDGKNAAVKVARTGYENDLLEEARNLAKLQSAYAPKYFGILIGDGAVGFVGAIGFVMERGRESLEQAIRAQRIIPDGVLEQAAKDMIALHAELTHHKIDYSDVKPLNLLIMADDSIRAIDIGGGRTHQYVGTYGQKMARSLLEAKLKTHLKPQYYGYKRAKAFEKYVARVVYRRATNLADVDDINSLDDLFKKIDLPNKPETEREKIFYYNAYGKDDADDLDEMKSGKKAPKGLKDMFLDYGKSDKMSLAEREREVFTEALEDAFSGDPFSPLKQELIKLYALPKLPKK